MPDKAGGRYAHESVGNPPALSTDRELLEALYSFLKERTFVAGDEASVRDMVQRYARPPLTMHYRTVMQMSVSEYRRLGNLLEKVKAHLEPEQKRESV